MSGGEGTRRVLTVAAAAVLFAVVSASASVAGEQRMNPRDKAIVAGQEAAAAEHLPNGRWDPAKVRALSRNVAGLPDIVAAEALWAAAAVSPRIDTINVFANALLAPSVPVRCVAVSILAGADTDDARRLLMNTLALEDDPEVVQTIVRGLANLPRNRAVRGLMDVMFLPGASEMATDAAVGELRRLTRVEIADTPVDWRDWWLDNEQLFD